MLYAGRYRFPWREGNQAWLLRDGEQFYSRMLESIAAARRSVLLELYLFESGVVGTRFVEAFVAAARRGVAVRLLLDDFGALGLTRADRALLRDGGVEVAFYNVLRTRKLVANLARDHRKLLLVDGEVAFTGGAGITDEYDPPRHPERRWRENMVEVRGPVVADFHAMFREGWDRHAARSLAIPPPSEAPLPDGMPARLAHAAGSRVREVQRALIKRLHGAERRAWIMTAYFVPSWRFRRALKRAAFRGVDVRLLLPGPVTDHPGVRHAGRRFFARLLDSGVRIFEYQPRFLHAKCALVDDWVSAGSSNYDRWSLRWNLEANLEIEDSRFAAAVAEMFERDFDSALACEPGRWRRRSWIARTRERFWGSMDRLLQRLGRGPGSD